MYRAGRVGPRSRIFKTSKTLAKERVTTTMANYGSTNLTTSQVNNGIKAIVSKTSQLTQVLRAFADLYDKELPNTEGLTTEAWMSAMGVERFVTAKGAKKGYTPGTIKAGWNPAMLTESGNMCTFKNVPAKYKVGKEVFRVYTLEEAKKLDGKPVTRYQLAEIADDKWTVAIVLKGIKQSRDYSTHNDRAVESALDYEGLSDLYIIRIVEKDGQQVREIVKIDKNEVYF